MAEWFSWVGHTEKPVKTENLTFEEALIFLKHGDRVRRDYWHDMYSLFISGVEDDPERELLITWNADPVGVGVLWTPTQEDLLAEDWKLAIK